MAKFAEFATRWDKPEETVRFTRDPERLIGCGTALGIALPTFRPFDMLSEPGQQLVLWDNEIMHIGVESRAGLAPPFSRGIDYDELLFQFCGATTVETEFGVIEMQPSEVVLIPAGIAHRSSGSQDSLRLFARVHEQVKARFTPEEHVSHSTFTMRRQGGPSWFSAGNATTPPKGNVVERMTRWGDAPEQAARVERRYEDLVGTAVGGRGVHKLRAFDFFTEITGTGGPGPVLYKSPGFMVEVYNTEAEQFAFHRGLDNDEVWLQFRGVSRNDSEFGSHELHPGQMNHVSPGVAHRVTGRPGFLRFVLYSDRPWRLRVDPTQHNLQSSFDPQETVIKEPEYRTQAGKARQPA